MVDYYKTLDNTKRVFIRICDSFESGDKEELNINETLILQPLPLKRVEKLITEEVLRLFPGIAYESGFLRKVTEKKQ